MNSPRGQSVSRIPHVQEGINDPPCRNDRFLHVWFQRGHGFIEAAQGCIGGGDCRLARLYRPAAVARTYFGGLCWRAGTRSRRREAQATVQSFWLAEHHELSIVDSAFVVVGAKGTTAGPSPSRRVSSVVTVGPRWWCSALLL